jgi:hypothetical protein
MKKFFIGTSLALATLAATPALAKTHHSSVQAASEANGYDASAAADPSVTASGPAIYSFGKYAGWDPDPNIRFQLLRDPGDLID